jgi:hypothetical protein
LNVKTVFGFNAALNKNKTTVLPAFNRRASLCHLS